MHVFNLDQSSTIVNVLIKKLKILTAPLQAFQTICNTLMTAVHVPVTPAHAMLPSANQK